MRPVRPVASALMALCLLLPAPSAAKKKRRRARRPAPVRVVAPPITQGDFIPSLFKRWPGLFGPAIEDPASHRLQVLVTEVVRRKGQWEVNRYGYRVDAEYFYPASAVKTLAVLGAFRQLARLAKKHKAKVGLDTPMVIEGLFTDQPTSSSEDETNVDPDPTLTGRITPRHEMRKLSIVSDNLSFDRLLSLVGHHQLNRWITEAGLAETALIHRLYRRRTPEENRQSPAMRLLVPGRKRPVKLSRRTSELIIPPHDLPGIDVGTAHLLDGERIEGPMSFREKNRMSLKDLQNMLILIMRPDIDLGLPGFELSWKARRTLQEMMRLRPGESENPILPEEKYDPLRFKPVLGGLQRFQPIEDWKVWSKAGKAYGFRVENAYIHHPKRGRRHALFVTVAIYANADGVVNDNLYEYDTVADPFIHGLVEALARRLWKLKPSRD